ncbi:hypothetical protein J2Z83_003783 [Virgibacillus natechei]|uniref:Uncharacterized protein n=1 Tax=Virgibacillus natechei TaxID=1216297 RepID=A0ABS4IKY7_9BACI|nr:hypothetical protein [Virgibacillus natechei]
MSMKLISRVGIIAGIALYIVNLYALHDLLGRY